MLKKIPKILTCLFVVIFVLQLIGLLVLVILPVPSQAADVKFIPQVGIGKDFEKGKDVLVSPDTIGKYIKAIYMYATGIVGILATVVLMFGGISWIAAGGNAQRIDNAKSWISAALTGLFLAMGSYMILNTINPKLIELQPIDPIEVLKMQTCCHPDNGLVPNIPVYDIKTNKITKYDCPKEGGVQKCTDDEICILKGNYYTCTATKGCCYKENYCIMRTSTGCNQIKTRIPDIQFNPNGFCVTNKICIDNAYEDL